MSGDADDFYANLPAFDDFPDVTDLAYYAPLPADWLVVIADIKGSTKAVREGRYKDVNLIGAACITAVLNALPGPAIPYVFGGDGATLAVPASASDAVRQVLGATQNLAREHFDLDLRAGMVPVADVRSGGADVLVAKFQLSPGNHMAMFAGGGVQLVDALIKAGNGGFRIETSAVGARADLNGLSCRWEPLKSCRGTMMSMLILATGKSDADKAATYRRVIEGVAAILEEDDGDTRPVTAENMVFTWPSRGLRSESRFLADAPDRWRKWLWLYTTSFIQFILEKFDLAAGGYDAPVYRRELRANSDFRRFDDMLRMILDCPIQMADTIEAFFSNLHERGEIVFGTHRSDHALMTCLVFSLTKGEHVHFVDGSDGGFSMAAVHLKARMRERLADGRDGGQGAEPAGNP